MKVKIKSSRGYHKMVKLPNKFEKVNKRKNNEYKMWRNKEKSKFDKYTREIVSNVWWLNLPDKEKKEMLKKYESSKIAKERMLRFTESPLSKIKTIDINNLLHI